MTSLPKTALPEISFRDADDATRAIYRQVMATAASGSPALIFRHLATYPGLLEWVWQAVGPEVESGWPRQLIWELRDATEPVTLDPISQKVLTSTGIDADARKMIDHMLRSYNRMNPINLVMIGGARMLLDPDFEAGDDLELPEVINPMPPPLPDLPSPPPVADLTEEMQAMFRRLCRTIPDTGTETTPTMYRHFAIWPEFMRTVGERLEAKMDALDQATLAFGAAARPLARTMAARAADTGPMPDVPDMNALLKTLDGFLYVIPHMVVVGKTIDAALAH